MEEETTLTTETFSNQEQGRRRVRRDRGSHQVTERDGELLGFIGEQYAVTLDQLAVLIGRSYRTARGLRDRWCDAGWTQSRRASSVDLPPFVWLTSRGSKHRPVTRFRTWQPNHGLVSPHRGCHQRPPPARARAPARRLGVRALARPRASHSRSETARAPPRRRPCHAAAGSRSRSSSRSRAAPGSDAIVLDVGDRPTTQVWYFAAPQAHAPRSKRSQPSPPWQNVRVHRYPPLAVEAAASARLV